MSIWNFIMLGILFPVFSILEAPNPIVGQVNITFFMNAHNIVNKKIYNKEKIDEWIIFLEALSYVESRHNPKAIGKTNDCGIYQITPIYLEECNKILGNYYFNLEDRYDPFLSILMVLVINNYYNPEMLISKAIKLHNPKAPDSYKEKIYIEMQNIKNRRKK